MDSLTQATLGAAMGEAVLGRKIGNRGMLWGALFGTLPDLDIIFFPFLDTAGRLAFHRGASHSLLVMVLASILLAIPLAKLWHREKITALRAGTFVFLVWSTHVLIDCFTVYGTSVMWPFTDERTSLDNLFIIDPLFTLPMLVTLVWLAFLKGKKKLPKRRKLLTIGLAISSIYVGCSFGFKAIAASAIERDLVRRGITYEQRMEAPTPFNILLWRAVVKTEGEFLIGYRSILDSPSSSIRWTVYPQHPEDLAPYAKENEVQTLEWFTKGWWIARKHVDGVWVADLRFGETRTYDQRPGMVDTRFMFSWSFLQNSELDRLQTNSRKPRKISDMLKRLGLRILGNDEIWHANPRITGVRGSLPVPLRVIE